MPIRTWLLIACFGLPGGMLAAQQPLSAIDWLGDPVPVVGPVGPRAELEEAPTATGVTVPVVSVAPIDEGEDRDAIGLLSTKVTGLPDQLWAASDFDALSHLIEEADFHRVPALQELLYTLMLAEAVPPVGTNAEAFLALRAQKLAEFGAVEPAEALVEQLPLSSVSHFAIWFDLTLLAGLEDKACDALAAARALSDDYAAQSFCALRQGNWEEAALILDTASALQLISRSEERLLNAFLDPEYAENAQELAPPRDVSPLEFRLHEAIGRPLPTANLPLAYAVADLRDLAGWKAQLEAAERLARVQAYAPNALLGLYTARKPAASGGVWERARAILNLEAALEKGASEELSTALRKARRALKAVGLEHALAEIYTPELALATLTEAGRKDRFELALMSKDYESAGYDGADSFLVSLAQGAPKGAAERGNLLAQAIEEGFSGVPISAALSSLMQTGKLGEAILLAARDMERGLDGDFTSMKSAITALRQMGLEAVTRRSALQMLLLRRES